MLDALLAIGSAQLLISEWRAVIISEWRAVVISEWRAVIIGLSCCDEFSVRLVFGRTLRMRLHCAVYSITYPRFKILCGHG